MAEIRTAVTALVVERDAQADAVMQAAHVAVVDLLARANRAEAVVEAARNILVYGGGTLTVADPPERLRLRAALDAYDKGERS